MALLFVLSIGAFFLASKETKKLTVTDDTPNVYLTFDDGPSVNTEKVLDILSEAGVKGTFFVVGKTGNYEKELYKRIVNEGHAIGIHSYTHNTSKIYKTMNDYLKDFTKIEEYIMEITGQRSNICRMPGGTYTYYCSKNLREEILKYYYENGYACFDWDIDPKDSGSYTINASQLSSAIIRQARNFKGKDIVILMHDDSLRTSLPIALESIITYFKETGYNFDVLSSDVYISSRK